MPLRLSRTSYAAIALIAGIVFFALAIAPGVYEETTPHISAGVVERTRAVAHQSGMHRGEFHLLGSTFKLTYHTLLRKAYSVVAFGVIGFAVQRALGWRARDIGRTAALLALFSAAIEVVQYYYSGSHEGFGWNLADVLCGAAGGWLGGVVAARFTNGRAPAIT